MLSWLVVATTALPSSALAPPAVAGPGPGPTATAVPGDRIAITFVSDRRDNGASDWFDSLGRPRRQAQTMLPEPTSAALWSATLVYTAQVPALRLTAGFTTTGSFARCLIAVNDEVRAVRTTIEDRGRVTCAR